MNDFYCENVFSGNVRVDAVVETDKVLAFHHTKPIWTTHVVVVPKAHVASLFEADDKTLLEILDVIKKVIEKLSIKDAYKIRTNGGSFQDSKHLHFHILAGEEL